MREQFLVTDTHPLIWYLANKESKLPKKVLVSFKSAQFGEGSHIWVPAAVAWEFSILLRKTDRIKAIGSYEELISENFFFKNLTLCEMLPEDLIIAHGLNFNRDPFDSLIVATAKRLSLPLISGDNEIIDSGECRMFWN
jgi:PIN domain nuclease of toxin-antitoxin system